jgi:hypothetical protein
MKKLIRHKFAYILFLFLTFVPILTFPEPCHAWGAVTNTSFVTAFISFFMNRSATPAGIGADVNTHVRLMATAYEYLANDPAWKDRQDLFPDIEGIKDWDRVYVYDVNSAMFHGGEWRWPGKNKGGPDAAGKTNDSEHYYNPVTGKGGAPAAVNKYYTNLIEQMHGSQDAKKDTISIEQLNKAAAWSAHYLADMHVPYHVVGVPAVPWYQLSEEQAGPAYLWDPDKLELDSEGKVVDSSITQPADTWGQGGDFSAATSYFKLSVLPKDTVMHDWFDPWYNNGAKLGLSPNAVIAVSSHAKWETRANKQLIDRAALVKPLSYLTGPTGWKNVTPSFGMPQQNMDNQAAQAEAFTIAAAKETRVKLASYLKSPSSAANKAIERIATLWRSSLTALRPSMEAKPDAGNPKLLKVTATIKSVEPNDPATRVKAKLTVEGGTITGKEIHDTDEPVKAISGKPVPVSPGQPVPVTPGKTVTVTPEKPWVTEWQVDSADPDGCKFKLEVICEYQKTPDLQYAIYEQVKPLSVTISPDHAEVNGKVTLTIKVEPPQKVELEVKDGGLLKPERGKESREKNGIFKVSTEKNGIFKGDYTVNEGTPTGKHEITVRAPKLNQEGTATLRVGAQYTRCSIELRTKIGGKYYDGKRTSDILAKNSIDNGFENYFDGSFTGNVFNGVLRLGDKQNKTGEIEVSVEPTKDPTVFKITGYSVEAKYETTEGKYYATEYRLSGQTPIDTELDAQGRNWLTATVRGADVCKDIKSYKSTSKISKEGTMSWIYDKPVCDANSYIKIRFYSN